MDYPDVQVRQPQIGIILWKIVHTNSEAHPTTWLVYKRPFSQFPCVIRLPVTIFTSSAMFLPTNTTNIPYFLLKQTFRASKSYGEYIVAEFVIAGVGIRGQGSVRIPTAFSRIGS